MRKRIGKHARFAVCGSEYLVNREARESGFRKCIARTFLLAGMHV
jgi:hypothetical protein